MNQIDKIMSCVARPNKKDLESVNSPFAKAILDQLATRHRTPLQEVLPAAPLEALDLVGKLLSFNPDKRLTAKQSLCHPYVSRFRDPEEELELSCKVVPYLDDNIQLSIEEYRDKLYESIIEKRKELIEARAHISSSRSEATMGEMEGRVPVEEGKVEDIEDMEDQDVGTSTPHQQHERQQPLSPKDHPLCSVSESSIPSHNTSSRPKAAMVAKSPPITTQQNYYGRTGGLRPYAPLEGPKRAPPDRIKSSAAFQSRHGKGGATPQAHSGPSKAWTVDSIYNTSAAPLGRAALKVGSPPVRAQGKQIPSNVTSDLVVTSARIIPSARPQNRAKKAARGTPSRFASGGYTQTHGVISSSQLALLKENRW